MIDMPWHFSTGYDNQWDGSSLPITVSGTIEPEHEIAHWILASPKERTSTVFEMDITPGNNPTDDAKEKIVIEIEQGIKKLLKEAVKSTTTA